MWHTLAVLRVKMLLCVVMVLPLLPYIAPQESCMRVLSHHYYTNILPHDHPWEYSICSYGAESLTERARFSMVLSMIVDEHVEQRTSQRGLETYSQRDTQHDNG